MKNWRNYRVEIAVFLLGVAAVNAIFISKTFRQSTTIDAEYAERLGAFVGGYVGSIFSLTGMILIYATLKNQQQNSQLQSFETKYFELLKMHRDNVAEIELKGESGRKFFVLLVDEFRLALRTIRAIPFQTTEQLLLDHSAEIAYYCIFFGVGPNSSRMLKDSIRRIGISEYVTGEVEAALSRSKDQIRRGGAYIYLPFDGHQSRLGHYYRHLYQMVRYVDQQILVEFDAQKKYEYVKTIRAQLSTHEQAMFLINSLTPIGRNWWRNGLITKYRLVKNIPEDFFNRETEVDTSKWFTPGYFEWEQVSAAGPI